MEHAVQPHKIRQKVSPPNTTPRTLDVHYAMPVVCKRTCTYMFYCNYPPQRVNLYTHTFCSFCSYCNYQIRIPHPFFQILATKERNIESDSTCVSALLQTPHVNLYNVYMYIILCFLCDPGTVNTRHSTRVKSSEVSLPQPEHQTQDTSIAYTDV